jgi:hypothetical protein
MGENNESNENTNENAKSDALTRDEAGRIRILVREDKAKYELEIARHQAAIGQLRLYIAECDATLADVDRREAGVMYPEPPKAPSAPTSPEEK